MHLLLQYQLLKSTLPGIRIRAAKIFAKLFAILLAACQLQSANIAVSAPKAPFLAPSHAMSHYIVDTQTSQIRLLVYRDGPMASFGHNHIITGQVRGEFNVSDTVSTSGFSIEIPVETFVVDVPASRIEEGAEFATKVSDDARQGTRRNMLGENVLDAKQHPLIRIESVALIGPRWNPNVTARITLRGKSSELKFPVAVFEQSDSLRVIAAFRVLQSDLGMIPFTVLGGALGVRDAIDVRVRLVARLATD